MTELLNEIKVILDITSRVDERVKAIQTNQQDLTARLNQFIGELNQLTSRVFVLESKNGGKVHALEEQIDNLKTRVERIDMGGTEFFKKQFDEYDETNEDLDDKLRDLDKRLQKIETSNEGWQMKFKHYAGLVIQGIWVIIVCYVLYKLGINTPPIP